MGRTGLWVVAAVTVVALYASHVYQEHQAYKTGVYIGKAAFEAERLQNRNDVTRDSVMEDALASASIIPSLADSTALRQGFRDGWRESRRAVADR